MPRTKRARPGLSHGGRSMNTLDRQLPACGKVQETLRGVNRFVSQTQQMSHRSCATRLDLQECERKCAKYAIFSMHRITRPEPPRNAKAPQPKIPRSAPESHV